MQRDEADSQPTLLAVSGVCGLIQANSRTVSEDGRLFLAAFHTDRTQKQWAGEKSYLQANQNFSVQSISAATEQEDVRQGEHAN